LERDQLPDRHGAVHDEVGTDPENGEREKLLDALAQRAGDATEVGGAEGGGDVAREDHFPFAVEDGLQCHRFRRLHARHCFDQVGLAFGAAVEFFFQSLAHQRANEEREADEKRQ